MQGKEDEGKIHFRNDHAYINKEQCDSARPACSRCKTLAVDCQYDVGQGVTRAERFRVMKNRQVTRTANLESLVDLLRTGCDVEASTVLARLRLGDRVEDIVQPLQANSMDSTPEPSGERCEISFTLSE